MRRLLLLLLCGSLAPRADAAILETFDAGNGDWQVVDYPFHSHIGGPATFAAPFDASFGNPPGSLRIGDSYPETGAAAPIAFLGDKSSCYGHTLTYDIYLRYVDVGAVYPAVVLNAGSLSLYYDAPAPAVDVWEPRVVLLTEVGWRRSSSGALVDEATFRNVLANLVGLYIYTEWHTGSDDTSLDNVCLNGVSVPADELPLTGPALGVCYPNPFNPATTIPFVLTQAGTLRLRILAPDGRCVRELLAGWYEPGRHATTWDGRDDAGRRLASGVYTCRLAAEGACLDQKLVLLK